MNFALSLQEVDEGVIDRQRPIWRRDLMRMLEYQGSSEPIKKTLSGEAGKAAVSKMFGVKG